MCGISGLIGVSREPKLSFEIASRLFEGIESRGHDASGYWGVSRSGSPIFHKEPTTPSDFVVKAPWKAVEGHDPTILLCHAREASKGVGPPENNENNHPFVSKNLSLAVIHNGRIPDDVYVPLKAIYHPASECDSEILLRMLERSHLRMEEAIFSAWNSLPGAHMAVAVGQKSRIWLFRNTHRTIWVASVGKLGQTFFFSTKQIWESAIDGLGIKSSEPEELAPGTVYGFDIDGSRKQFVIPT